MTIIKPIPTKQENKLADALRSMNVVFEQQYWDGHKHIDIFIPESKLNIEIDGSQHLTNSDQIIRDFNREYWADKKGYYTLHIPNGSIDGVNFDKIVNAIVEVVNKVAKNLSKINGMVSL